MMKLRGINGSPRGKSGNSAVFLQAFMEGFSEVDNDTVEIVHLRNVKNPSEQQRLFSDAEIVFIAFPLYVDSMPALVKAFFENLDLSNKPKAVGFLIQSGFPEAMQLRNLEKYCHKLGRRIGENYVGTIVKGSGELIRIPSHMQKGVRYLIYKIAATTNLGGLGYMLNTKKQLKRFRALGKSFGETGALDDKLLRKIAKPERISKFSYLLFKFIGEKFYWDSLLKKNKAFTRSFDKPDAT